MNTFDLIWFCTPQTQEIDGRKGEILRWAGMRVAIHTVPTSCSMVFICCWHPALLPPTVLEFGPETGRNWILTGSAVSLFFFNPKYFTLYLMMFYSVFSLNSIPVSPSPSYWISVITHTAHIVSVHAPLSLFPGVNYTFLLDAFLSHFTPYSTCCVPSLAL
jgi:hypothetical protein